MKKYGLLAVHTEPHGANIGDYIQAIAASQFIGRDYLFVERERLDEYDGQERVVVMNGWFMHHTEHWPPSSAIRPVFVSFHIVPYAADDMLGGEKLDYLKRYEPIGCRDKTTMNLLLDHNVKAYYTGCLTLTLGRKYKFSGVRKGVFFADPYYYVHPSPGERLKALAHLLSNYRRVSAAAGKMFERRSVKNLLKASMFHMQYSRVFDRDIMNAFTFVRHERPDYITHSNAELLSMADELLRNYCNAELVVTSRIHCALPCTAMEVPVLYVHNADDDHVSASRLPGIFDYFNVILNEKGRMKLSFLGGAENRVISLEGGLPPRKTNWKKTADELAATLTQLLSEID